jgi:hypothetical protein
VCLLALAYARGLEQRAQAGNFMLWGERMWIGRKKDEIFLLRN